jgi:hypothetical protein
VTESATTKKASPPKDSPFLFFIGGKTLMPDPIKPVWVSHPEDPCWNDPEFLRALEEEFAKDQAVESQEKGLTSY